MSSHTFVCYNLIIIPKYRKLKEGEICMNRRITVFLLMTCMVLNLIAPLNTQAATSPGVMYYSLNHNEEFVKTNQFRSSSAPTLNFSNYTDFKVDGVPYKFKVNKVTYNASETNNQPYINFTRMASIANGQVNAKSKSLEYSTTVNTSHISKKTRGFSFGASIGAPDKSVTSKLVKAAVGSSLGFSTSRSFSRSNTTNELTKNTAQTQITLQVPSLPQYKDCNGVDFYVFTNTYVYDVEAVISMPDTTDNKYLGYTNLSYTNKRKSGRDYRCNRCWKVLRGTDMLLPAPEEPEMPDMGEPTDTRIVHLDLASGGTAHCSLEQWEDLNNSGLNHYAPYFEHNNTKVTFRVYWPETQGVAIPWYLDNNPQIVLNKPISLVPNGAEKIIYDNGSYYKMVIEDSHLIDSNYSVGLPGQQIHYPMLPGMIQNYADSKTVATTHRIEKIKQKSSKFSVSLVAKVFGFLKLSGGHNRSKTITNSTSTTTTESKTVTINNSFKLPSSYIEQGYDGASIFVTESGLLYEIRGKLYPITRYGDIDTSHPESITMTQKVEFPKTFAKPYKVTP